MIFLISDIYVNLGHSTKDKKSKIIITT